MHPGGCTVARARSLWCKTIRPINTSLLRKRRSGAVDAPRCSAPPTTAPLASGPCAMQVRDTCVGDQNVNVTVADNSGLR